MFRWLHEDYEASREPEKVEDQVVRLKTQTIRKSNN